MPAGGYSPKWTDEEDAYLRANFSLRPVKQLAAELGRPRSGVAQRGVRFGLVSYQQIGTRSIQHDYFDRIDTPAKAYVLGLLAADGYISPRYQLALALSAKDRSAVDFVRDELAPTSRVGEYQVKNSPMVKFAVQSARLGRALAGHGIVPAKSHIITWPSAIPDQLANSYIGGYFDGDGSLAVTGRHRWTIVSGSVPLLEAIQQHAFNQTGTWLGGPYKDGRKNCWSVVATGRGQVRDLDEWIRADVPGLARKRLAQDQVPVEPERSVFWMP